jgi:hypothetical protein
MMSEEVVIKVYSPTTDAEVLYINREGVRGIVLLEFIRRIKDYISLLILF